MRTNYTTIEQSRELLDLGIPAETCDCCIIDESDLNDPLFTKYSRIIFGDAFSKAQRLKWSREGKGYFPCWSVGRLLEIVDDCISADWLLTDIYKSTMYSNDKAGAILKMLKENELLVDFSNFKKD